MNEDGAQPRPRRFAKACDTCYKRKVRCEGESIPCQQCQRRGQTCTFTRAEPDINKPRRAGRQLKVVSDRLQHVETLLAEARRREQEHGKTQAEPPLDPAKRDALLLSTQLEGDILAEPIPHEILVVLELYGEQFGRFYPYIQMTRVITTMLQPRSRTEEETAILRPLVRALLSLAFRMANFSASNDKSFNADQEADRQLSMAIADCGPIIAAMPSVLCVQALLSISLSMTISSIYSLNQASMMLASAVRGAIILGLDRVQGEAGNALAQSTRESVLYRCVHNLDLELSSVVGQPPSMYAVDSSIGIRSSPDGKGVISSLDDKYKIDVYAARCELAALQRQVWEECGERTGLKRSRALSERTSAALFGWFNEYTPLAEHMREDLWPATVYVHIARLVLVGYRTLAWVEPQLFTCAHTLATWLDEHQGTPLERLLAMQAEQKPPILLVSLTKIVFAAIRSIGKAGLPWLAESFHENMVGCLVLFQAVIHMSRPDLAEKDFDQAQSWMELLKNLYERAGDEGQLAVTVQVLDQLLPMAETALQMQTNGLG